MIANIQLKVDLLVAVLALIIKGTNNQAENVKMTSKMQIHQT